MSKRRDSEPETTVDLEKIKIQERTEQRDERFPEDQRRIETVSEKNRVNDAQ